MIIYLRSNWERMIDYLYTIRNSVGFHMRPAKKVAEFAASVESDIYIEYKGQKVSGKRLLQIITLGITYGNKIKIVIDGGDEEKTLEKLQKFLEENEI